MKTVLAFFIAALLWAPTSAVSGDLKLMMAEEAGCIWCARWDREISHIYPKTEEGRTAPLMRFNIHDGTPQDVLLTSRVRFTPTFILVQEGREIGRIEGYPGEDFFWGLLAHMIEKASIPVDKTG